MKVGYLGPKGSFSYEVCNNYCQDKKEQIEYKTITDTILALEKNEVDEVIVPIENSLQGCVTEAIDTLIRNEDIKVKGELLLSINQNLMANGKYNFNEIEKVYSHPQALAQCKDYLNNNFKNTQIIAVESTSYAGKIVSNSNEKCACIGNIACLDVYNLKLIASNIQDNTFNKTKFWILGKSESNNNKKEKMSLIFSVKDRPGALYRVLEIFNKHSLNLTKIESRPAKTVLGEYYFWVDVSINENSTEIEAINEIRKSGIYVRLLGCY